MKKVTYKYEQQKEPEFIFVPKRNRIEAIREILRCSPTASNKEIYKKLEDTGWEITHVVSIQICQARRELRIVRVPE